MPLLIDSVVRRHLKYSPYFSQELPTQLADLAPVSDEPVIGCYQNPPPWHEEFLVFTQSALHILTKESRQTIKWRDIRGYIGPATKERPTGVHVQTDSGVVFVRAAGAGGPEGKYPDALALQMILQAVKRASHSPP